MNAKEPLTDTTVVIIARYPILGKTKTRLARTFGDNNTLHLYRAFLADLALHHMNQAYTVCWTYTPGDVAYHSLIEGLAPNASFSRPTMRYFPQRGEGLGERLHHAFQWTYTQGYRHTVLIGSDSPHIQPSTIVRARAALDETDIVLGPAEDGGYYLIGMKKPYDVFSGIPMSTSEVLAMTIASAQHQGLRVQTIESLFDVDEMSDLQRLASLLAVDRALAPTTAAYLEHQRILS